MAKDFRSLNDLFGYVEKNMQSVLKKEAADLVVETMSSVIQEETYKQYTPTGKNKYERRGLRGGLADKKNYHVEIIDDNTISIENLTRGNTRYSGSTSGAIDGIIVYGTGYTWKESKIYQLQPFPRDFYGGTVRRLQDSGEHIEVFKRGLLARGIKAE